jgi:hypothetical protein
LGHRAVDRERIQVQEVSRQQHHESDPPHRLALSDEPFQHLEHFLRRHLDQYEREGR